MIAVYRDYTNGPYCRPLSFLDHYPFSECRVSFSPPSNLYFYQCSLLCPWCYLFCPLQIWKTNCCWLHIAKGLACSQYLKLWYKSSWIFPALHVLPNSSFESHKL